MITDILIRNSTLDLMQRIESAIDQLWPRARWRDTRVLVAVSGGADSVALLCALARLALSEPMGLEGRLQAAHYNHGWRGTESDADEVFVRTLCQRLKVSLVVGRNEMPVEHKMLDDCPAPGVRLDSGNSVPVVNSEESARRLRYDFLTQAAYQCGARYVITAHTASDRVETMLHNLFRGTGLSGVVGPSAVRCLGPELVLVRPLLGCWREEIEEYLATLNQGFRNDSSNSNTKYQRNYLRHELLPELRERFGGQIDGRLLSFSELAAEAIDSLQELANEYLRQVESLRNELSGKPWQMALEHSQAIYLPRESKLACPWPIVHRALQLVWQAQDWPLQAMSREQWETVRKLMYGPVEAKQANLPGGLIARREGNWLAIARPPASLDKS